MPTRSKLTEAIAALRQHSAKWVASRRDALLLVFWVFFALLLLGLVVGVVNMFVL